MTDNRKIYAGIALFVILTLVLFWLNKGDYQWEEHYKADSNDPYGTKVIKELLESTDRPFHLLKDSISVALPTDSAALSNYVFIGQSMYLSSDDISQLNDFVAAGNQVFLCCNYVPHNLMLNLYGEECTPTVWTDFESIVDTAASLQLNHDELQVEDTLAYVFLNRFGSDVYQWTYFLDDYFCENEGAFAELGTINDTLINFARVEYGLGYYYIHTTPVAFTNVNLLEEATFDYANKVFSHLNEGAIYWDEYSRTREQLARSRDNRPNSKGLSSKGAFQYILSQPALTWAWYLLLGMGVLFLVFRAKRRERIIPVLPQNKNASLEFVRTVGRLYFLQNNHKQLALQKMKLFHIDIKEHYNIHFQDGDETFEERIVARSGVSAEVVRKIFLMHDNIKSSSYVSSNTLIDFYHAMARFYKDMS